MSPNQRELELMRQALSLATRGRGLVEPNPMVGCIIERGGEILGSGYHQRFGEPHAEPNALADCKVSPAGATAIVTLEPCCHTRKKTLPCVPALISAGIRRVVIGSVDPNPAVAGNGAAQLRAAGVEVVTGGLEAECDQLNAPFFALMRHGRPYVTLKWAQSTDGLVAGSHGSPRRISNPASSRLVHLLRTRCDAILVSADTVLHDDPLLSVRDVPVIRRPVRVVVDTRLRIPVTARLVTTASEIPTHVFTAVDDETRLQRFRALGVIVHCLPATGSHVDLPAVLATLGGMRLTHVLAEPGPRLAYAFLERNLVDRLWVIRSPKALNEPDAPQAVSVPFATTGERSLEGDVVSEYLNPASPVFFHASHSVDLML